MEVLTKKKCRRQVQEGDGQHAEGKRRKCGSPLSKPGW